MTPIKRHRTTIIKLLTIITGMLVIVLLTSFRTSVDKTVSNTAYSLIGESKLDTSIVLITISANDIESLGGWPLKRSYYALLINQIEKFNPRKIGIEVFLSDKLSTQSIYDNLLYKEIKKAANVVICSLPINVVIRDNVTTAGGIEFPAVKKKDNLVQTGHIIYFDSGTVRIPTEILVGSDKEPAFFVKLLESDNTNDFESVNFVSSWNNFIQYDLLDFFALVQNGDNLDFSNKIVLIGVTDPQYCAKIETPFDKYIPGVALHAFALDNQLANRFLNTISDVYTVIVSAIVLFLLLVFSSLKVIDKKLKLVYSAVAILGLALYTIMLTNNIVFSFSIFLFPFAFLSIAEISFYVFAKQKRIRAVMDESETLKILLSQKVNELHKLESEVILADEKGNSTMQEKIRVLQEEIKKLKVNEDDNFPADNNYRQQTQNFFGMFFRSKSMKVITGFIEKVAPSNETILILGESGTGKELTARAIHLLSSRKDANFVAVNCGALTETLLESELFGHVKGAFTGAVTDKIGRFEAANGGTIFLDEIGEISENFQVKLLRVLQSSTFEKVGSSISKKTDVRVIAATNKNIDQLAKEGKFREDLYYRLNVIKISLPPLRERKEDIPVIVNHLLQSIAPNILISQATHDALLNYDWRGNIRELESAIKRAIVLANGSNKCMIQVTDLPEEVLKDFTLNYEDIILESLRYKKFSHSAFTETAKELGVNRTVVSENFRGVALRIFVEQKFDKEKSINIITAIDDSWAKEKVEAKLNTFLKNIESDVNKLHGSNFDAVKNQLNSKYKNLPKKFHYYLDEIIKYYLENQLSG